jgi:hypothetical protein
MVIRPGVLLAGMLCLPGFAAAPSPREIVKNAAAAAERDWNRAPEYSYCEREVVTNGRSKTVRTQQVLMIDGSPYKRLTAVDGRSLSSEQQADEERKLEAETARRAAESAEVRDRRIAEFARRHQRDHALMKEIPEAFEFRIIGERNAGGRRVWVLAAEPRPGYRPASLYGRVLKSMRGTLWIDQQNTEWVRVEGEVFEPVTLGRFLAKVQPGTKFLLEQAPVAADLWLPIRFSLRVDSSVLLWSRRSARDETYWNYQPGSQAAALGCAVPAKRLTR